MHSNRGTRRITNASIIISITIIIIIIIIVVIIQCSD